MNGVDLQLPPGFRFHPTDEELVLHYLCRKCAAMPIAVPIIADVDLYKFDPWLLPGMASYGAKEWYFFSPRDRKYPNGSRPNRSAGSGYWKATGADKPVCSPRPVGIKKALVFYTGKAPKGVKTNWIMHEYRLADVDRAARRKTGLRLDDWVLCRIYNKRGSTEKHQLEVDRKSGVAPAKLEQPETPERKPVPMAWHVQDPTGMNLWSLESTSRLHHAESSCSEHVVSAELVTCERGEVASQPRWGSSLEKMALESCPNHSNGISVGGVEFLSDFGSDPLQDILMFLHKPF